MSVKKIRAMFKLMRKNADAYILAAPFLLLFIMFTAVPAVMMLVLSFFSYDLAGMSEFAGVENFRALFMPAGEFSAAFANSMLIFLIAGVGGFVLSVLAAWGLEFLNKKAADILTAVLFVLSSVWAVTGAVWLSPTLRAPLNSLVMSVGERFVLTDWLSDEKCAIWCVIIAQIPCVFGIGFLTLRSGFRGIDRERADAAKLEGVKNPFRILIHAQLPLIYPQLAFAAAVQTAYAFTNAELLRIVSGTAAEDFGAYGILTYIFDYSGRLDAGKAYAANLVLIAVMTAVYAIIRVIMNRLSKRV